MSDYDLDQNNLMGPHGEDQILYTAIYANLIAKSSNPEKYTKEMAQIAINTILVNGELPTADLWSFDMNYGIVSLSKQFGLGLEKRFWWGQTHYLLVPRDLILFAWVSGGMGTLLSLPFLWIWSLWTILGMAISSYKTINGSQVLATDLDLITWLVLNTFNFPITKKIVDYIAKKKYGSYSNLALIYYGSGHPIYKLMLEQGL